MFVKFVTRRIPFKVHISTAVKNNYNGKTLLQVGDIYTYIHTYVCTSFMRHFLFVSASIIANFKILKLRSINRSNLATWCVFVVERVFVFCEEEIQSVFEG
jgi:hypothetical protein